MSSDEQLRRWVAGEPVHNNERGECCPDFSCCEPSLLAPQEVREEFAAADEDKQYMMLGQFLGAALANMGKRDETYICGVDTPVNEA
jgi:hypothetical protein